MSDHPPAEPDDTSASPAADALPVGSEDELTFWAVFRKLGPAAWLGILWGTAPAIMGFWLLASLGPVSRWLQGQESVGPIVYVVLFTVSAGAGFLPTYAQAIVGGWVFGFWIGFGAAIMGFTCASVVGRVIARFIARDRVEKLVERHPKSAVIRKALVGRGFWHTLGVVTLVRVPPNSPFALTNLLLSSVGVGPLAYVLGTALGMAPRTAVAAYMASHAVSSGATDIQSLVKHHPWWYLPLCIILFLMVIAIIGAIAERALKRLTNATQPQAPSP